MTAAPDKPTPWSTIAVILCIALPVAVLIWSADPATNEQIDAAETILVGRVAALELNDHATVLTFDVDEVVVGARVPQRFVMTMTDGPRLDVGDRVLAFVDRDPPTILGAYRLMRPRPGADWHVVTPVTGMAGYGIVGGGLDDPVPLALLLDAIRERRGLGARALAGGVAGVRPEVAAPYAAPQAPPVSSVRAIPTSPDGSAAPEPGPEPGVDEEGEGEFLSIRRGPLGELFKPERPGG